MRRSRAFGRVMTAVVAAFAFGGAARSALAQASTAQASEAPECGFEIACEIEGGSYHLIPPDNWDGVTPLPAIMFFHGHRSSGASALKGSVRSVFGGAGYLVIAPNGDFFPGQDYRYWPGRPGGGERDDLAFSLAVFEDAKARVPIDEDRVLVSGFSAGGSMAWMIACYEGARFSAFASVAGALRRPAPEETCPGGPFRMLQIHGFSDTQVPLEGRGIRDWHQGDVFESLALLRRTNGCRSNPNKIELGSPFWRRIWNDGCASGRDVRLYMHDGGHGMPKGWAEATLDWFEAGPQAQ